MLLIIEQKKKCREKFHVPKFPLDISNGSLSNCSMLGTYEL